MDLWVREARLFKYGSGTGTNFSALRGSGESLSGGGKSSGLMSSSTTLRCSHCLLRMDNPMDCISLSIIDLTFSESSELINYI